MTEMYFSLLWSRQCLMWPSCDLRCYFKSRMFMSTLIQMACRSVHIFMILCSYQFSLIYHDNNHIYILYFYMYFMWATLHISIPYYVQIQLFKATLGEGVKKAVGDQVYFRPDTFPDVHSVTNIIWKHINTSRIVVRAIEWDREEPGFLIPNPRFKGITTVDYNTGQITIANLKVEHSGVYTIDINSKEQERFNLTVMERVPKPVIEVQETEDDPDVVYLRCKYSETIIWKNSAGKTLNGLKLLPTGQFIIVKNKGNPVNFHTCTLMNAVSNETSDPVYERDLFEDVSGKVLLGILITITIIQIIIISFHFVQYEVSPDFLKFVEDHCPLIEGLYSPALTKINAERRKS